MRWQRWVRIVMVLLAAATLIGIFISVRKPKRKNADALVQRADPQAMIETKTGRLSQANGLKVPGFIDFEDHTTPATRFGLNVARSHESRYAPLGSPPNANQIKLSDGVNPFDLGAFADGVTVTSLTYKVFSLDAGYKLHGFTAQAEWWWRKLDDMQADGPLPLTSVNDRGGQLQLSQMVIPRTLAAYVAGGYIWDQFDRSPWEAGGGLSYYPSFTRSWRLNAYAMHVNKSPAASSFGYYVAGLTGTIFSLGTDILF